MEQDEVTILMYETTQGIRFFISSRTLVARVSVPFVFSAFSDVNYYCVSAMDSSNLTYAGRPHGGVAIFWKSRVNANISPIEFESK